MPAKAAKKGAKKKQQQKEKQKTSKQPSAKWNVNQFGFPSDRVLPKKYSKCLDLYLCDTILL